MRHVRNVIAFVASSPGSVTKSVQRNTEKLASTFEPMWRKKVIQFQIPLFAESTKSDWLLLFDDVLANALELGPLRSYTAEVSDDGAKYLRTLLPEKMPLQEAIELIAYYKINKFEDSQWAPFPSTNFEAFFGNTNFTHKYQKSFFDNFGLLTKERFGVTRYCIYNAIAELVQVTEI